jgi:hypothetical protein
VVQRISAIAGTVAAVVVLIWPSSAGASVRWVCKVPGEGDVTFVTAADAARHGIDTANARAGQTFKLRFGEVCRVEQP